MTHKGEWTMTHQEKEHAHTQAGHHKDAPAQRDAAAQGDATTQRDATTNGQMKESAGQPAASSAKKQDSTPSKGIKPTSPNRHQQDAQHPARGSLIQGIIAMIVWDIIGGFLLLGLWPFLARLIFPQDPEVLQMVWGARPALAMAIALLYTLVVALTYVTYKFFGFRGLLRGCDIHQSRHGSPSYPVGRTYLRFLGINILLGFVALLIAAGIAKALVAFSPAGSANLTTVRYVLTLLLGLSAGYWMLYLPINLVQMGAVLRRPPLAFTLAHYQQWKAPLGAFVALIILIAMLMVLSIPLQNHLGAVEAGSALLLYVWHAWTRVLLANAISA